MKRLDGASLHELPGDRLGHPQILDGHRVLGAVIHGDRGAVANDPLEQVKQRVCFVPVVEGGVGRADGFHS